MLGPVDGRHAHRDIDHPEWDGSRRHTRGWVIQRVFSHDIYHAAELNETLEANGIPMVDLWE